jgi:hypothetical protein
LSHGKPADKSIRQAQAFHHRANWSASRQALTPRGTPADRHACRRRRRLCDDGTRKLRAERTRNGRSITAAKQRLPRARIFIPRRVRRLGRIVVAQQFIWRRSGIRPIVGRHVLGIRVGRSDARRIRFICALPRSSFLRNLSADNGYSHEVVRHRPFTCPDSRRVPK